MTIKSSCLVVLFAFVAMTVNSVFSYAMEGKMDSQDKQQQEAIAKFDENEKLRKQPDCLGPLELIIANTKFRVSRYYGTKIILKDGTQIESVDKICGLKIIENVKVWAIPGFGLSDIEASSSYESTFVGLQKEIQLARNEGKSIVLQNGLERIFSKGHLIYIVPLDIISAYNNEPIAFDCGGVAVEKLDHAGLTDNCGTRYPINKDISVGYSFFRKAYPDQNYLQADKKKRDLFKSLMVEGE